MQGSIGTVFRIGPLRPHNAPSHTLTGAFPFPNQSGPGGATNTVTRGLTATKERLMGNASAPVTDAPMGVDRGHR